MNRLILPSIALLVGCSTAPKCGIETESSTIFRDTKSCAIRIRQVIVATKLNLPKSVSASSLATWNLSWRESDFKGGQIDMGHFVLTSPTVEKGVTR